MQPVSKDLPPEIQVWLRTWREVVLNPLRTLRWNSWSIQRMADELALRVEGRQGAAADGRIRDASGVSKTTLQKEMAGERMPTRDVVQHLLDIALEHLPEPPSPESQKALWDSYYPALERKVPLLVSLYKAIDERDEAVRALAAAQDRENRLLTELKRTEHQEYVIRAGLERAQADIERAGAIAWERGIRLSRIFTAVPGGPDAYGEILRALWSASRELSRQLATVSSELDELRGQSDKLRRAAWRALRVVRRAQRKRERELIAEVAALRAERDELVMRLERAQSEAEETRYQARGLSNDVAHGLIGWRRLDAFEELRRRADDSTRVEAYLVDELARSREGLEVARAEVNRQGANLARLVEEQSTRIARLRESSVLSEADDVLAAALGQLGRELGG